jgi:TolB-like protein/DNA-binding winged helix-turn-helix (wHTH) protein/Tfp pilus assembly protein PilF
MPLGIHRADDRVTPRQAIQWARLRSLGRRHTTRGRGDKSLQSSFAFLRKPSGVMKRSPLSYRFGPFCLEVDRRVLVRDGAPVPLSPKALDTLLVLIEHRDRIITKDELLQQIWRETVVEEGGLTRNISILRKTLGETPDDHQFIVTVPGRGYRFVADVREAGGVEPFAAHGQEGLDRETVGPNDDARASVAHAAALLSGRSLTRSWLWLGGLAVLTAGLLVYVLRPTNPNAGRPTITAIAVLPLDNLSGDASQEYFADGMTEALIGTLARIRALRVVSRTSVMRFKGATRPLSEIAQTLNVDAVLEGSVQRTGDRVRISVQLLYAPTDSHLWTREYERELTDVLKLQSEVAQAVADEIQVRLTAEERARLESAGSVNPAAYQEYLLGQHYLWRPNEENLVRAIAHFEESARIDPTYAAAYAGLSHAWWWRGIWGAALFKEVESPSRTAAAKALELDPNLPEARVSMGRIKFGHEWDWTGAGREFKRALAIDPNNADAHFFSAMLCMALGCFAESIDHMKQLEKSDPLSPTVQSFLGRVLYRARRHDEAIAHLKRAIELDPQSPAGAYDRLADVYEAVGRYDEALALVDKAATVAGRPRNETGSARAARIYALMGKRREATAILEASRGANGWTLAAAYEALGKNDEAFRQLLRIAEEHPGFDVYVKTDPVFDSLHSDPRWKEVLRRMNYPSEEETTVVAGSR